VTRTILAAAALAAYACAAGAAQWSFDRQVITVGNGPGSIAIADVNHDCSPDLLVLNTLSLTMTVLLGDGHGQFRTAPFPQCATGAAPNDIAVADFNGDGHPDVAIANTGTPTITILLGDGRGGFTPAPGSPFATQSNPHVHGVAAADFTGDGRIDVATDSWGHNQALLLTGDGRGGLVGPGRPFDTGKRPYERLRTGDFNQDGHPDLVTTDMDINAVTILLGDGNGGFHEAPGSPVPAGAAPWAVAVDDLNRDGTLDLAVIPYDRDLAPAQLVVSILFGDGKGGLTTRGGAPLSLDGCHGPDRIATGNVLGHGPLGLAVSCAQNDTIMAFAPAAGGAFVRTTLAVQTGWSGLAIGDLNGDGKADIIVANGTSDANPQRPANTVTIFFSR
jgi:hypothetical protein